MNEEGKKKKEEEEKEIELNFGIGKISFGGLFKGIGNLIDLVSKLSEEAEEIKKEGEVKLGKEIKGVYGFSIRTLVGGKPIVETFGNIRETPKGPVVEEVREPIVDIFDEKDHILMVAELPGVEQSDIQIEIKEDILNISAERGERKYRKEVLLPTLVDETTKKTTYKNGILEIEIKKKQE
ncbi:MAG: archaeal heat shock protein Hsp20 [Acidobacteriota bacterium]